MWRWQAGMGALSRTSMLVPPVQASSPQSGGEEGLLLSTSGQPEHFRELPSFSGVLPVFFDFSDACSVCFAFWLDFPWFPCSFPQASLRNKIC